jgi:hypothetical protein
MGDDHPRPGGVILAWLTVVGTLVALVLLARSQEPLSIKLVIVGLAVLGICLIVVFHLGRWRERARLSSRIHALERRLERTGLGQEGSGRNPT